MYLEDWVDYCSSTLSAAITDTATTLNVQSGDGDGQPFPTLHRRCVIFDAGVATPGDDPNRELVKITSRAGDVISITRGLGRTSAKAWPIDSKVWHVMSAEEISKILRKLVQRVEVSTSSIVTMINVFPIVNTVPDIGDGTQLLSKSITPTAVGNIIEIEINLLITNQSNGFNGILGLGLFDGGESAIKAIPKSIDIHHIDLISYTFRTTATGTSPVTFSIRGGPHVASQAWFKLNANGIGGGLFGGVEISNMIIKEYTPE